MCQLRDDDFLDEMQPVALVCGTQATATFAAKVADPDQDIATFKAWLQLRQDMALRGMNATQGDAFIDHAGAFTMFLDALQVVCMYEREARG